MEISNMNNYTNFLNVCIAIYNKGKDLSHALPVIINKYLDTSDTESLKSDLRNFYAENIKDFQRLKLSLTQLNSCIDSIDYRLVNIYTNNLEKSTALIDTKTLKKLQANNELQKAEYKLINDTCQKIADMLHVQFNRELLRDFDTNAYMLISDTEHQLLSYNEVFSRISNSIQISMVRNETDLPFQIEKRLPQIINDFLKSLTWGSSFSLSFFKGSITPATPYTSITDFLKWDQKTLSITNLTAYIDYVCISLFVMSHWHTWQTSTIAKPSVFPLLVNTDKGTGKTTFVYDFLSVFYPVSMIYQTCIFPTEKELLENIAHVDSTRNLQGKAVIFFDEFETADTPYNRLKELLTKENITARTAYSRTPQTISNNRFYIFTSNTDNQLPTAERRFMVIPKFRYIGNRARTVSTLKMIATRAITQFTTQTTEQQIQNFNNLERNMQTLAIKTTQQNNRLYDLAENYRDLINNFFLEHSYSGYITPSEFKNNRQFTDLSKLSKKELCHVLSLCGYDYKRTTQPPRVMAFIPTAETKKELYT